MADKSDIMAIQFGPVKVDVFQLSLLKPGGSTYVLRPIYQASGGFPYESLTANIFPFTDGYLLQQTSPSGLNAELRLGKRGGMEVGASHPK